MLKRNVDIVIKDILGISPGTTAVIGSGGKTSLIRRLAGEICPEAKVIICTTTHIMRPEDIPVFEAGTKVFQGLAEDISQKHHSGKNEEPSTIVENLSSFISHNSGKSVCAGVTDPDNSEKLVSFPIEVIKQAAGQNAYILVEADGSKHMPLKAHNDREPVIPAGCDRVILVVGAEGIGKTITEAAHRPELFAALAEADVNEIVTPQMLAKVLAAERRKFGNCRLQVVVNRMDIRDHDLKCENDIAAAKKIAELTGWEVYAGCVKSGIFKIGNGEN